MHIPPAKKNDAVMFDIDDTLISSKTGKRKEIVYKFYTLLQKLGYKMIIVTARPGFASNVLWTQRQLASHNIVYDKLVFTPAANKGNYKKNSGYNFVVSVGDMDTDLTHTQIAVKIST